MGKVTKSTIDTTAKALPKPKYDPSKNYKWEETDVFTLTGVEFAYLYKTIKIHVSQGQGAPAIDMVKIHEILNKTLEEGVASGIIVEVAPPTPEGAN